jgi:diguanylate cyclase (GGDEF)-like protein
MRLPLILQSFRFRILALVLGLVTVVVVGTIAAVVVKAHAEVERQAASQLQTAAGTAREVLKFRGEQLSSAVEVLTSDFGFKEAVASKDLPTLRSAMDSYRGRIGADVLIVMDSEGHLAASARGTVAEYTLKDLRGLVTEDTDGQMLRFYRLIDGRPYQLVLSPVLAPDAIGWAAMGFALDDKVAADMARLLGVQVSFVARESSGPDYVATSWTDGQKPSFADITSRNAGSPFLVNTGADERLTWINPIRSANGSLTLVLQQSLDNALRPYIQLRRSIIAIGFGVLAVACALAALLARSATRPFAELTRAAERLEAGDYDTIVPPASTTEIARLSSAFNAMRAAVGERERVIRHQAVHDPLTDLPSRLGMSQILDELLPRMLRDGTPVIGCTVNIAQFNDLVGSYGHAAADDILRNVAQRLADGIRTADRVARISTDQFFVVLEGVDSAHALRAAGGIAELLRAPFEYQDVSLQLETRIGVAIFPDDAGTAAELLQRADLALYRAIESGVPVSESVPGDDQLQRHRLAILGDLRRAIAAEELELHFQPKVALNDGAVVGCEALVRWRHPVKGLIPPNEFIAHAERTGLIRLLTAWVMEAAFRQHRAWEDQGITIDMSVNVSPADLADPGFADSVMGLLRKTGVNAECMVLEVTESGAMKDLPQTLRIMEELRLLGIRFSIDDFGTGHSSLAHLRRLPVDEIKIDRSFVKELDGECVDDVILRSTIELGHALNLKVVAEGVETAAGWQALDRFGCDLVQGYYISKPLPAAAFSAWLAERPAPPLTPAVAADVQSLGSWRARAVHE